MNIFVTAALFLALSQTVTVDASSKQSENLLVVTVATDGENDGLRRLKESVAEFGSEIAVFGVGQTWSGGDLRNAAGGAQKIRILREGLKDLIKSHGDSVIVLFVDAYDVVLNANAAEILTRFRAHFDGARVVFGAEPFCWPDRSLAQRYPLVTFGERFLNSGGFIGHLGTVLEMLDYGADLQDDDDDQLFYTNLYLNPEIRKSLGMALDSLSYIFQNLNGLSDSVSVEFNDVDGHSEIFNELYNTHPAVIHGNGPSKLQLNAFANYIGRRYNRDSGCRPCQKMSETVAIEDRLTSTPTVALAIFVAKPTPYVEEFFNFVKEIDYPQARIHLLVYNNQRYNMETVSKFVADSGRSYASVEVLNLKTAGGEQSVRNFAMKWARSTKADHFFMLDADVHLSNPLALRRLIEIATAMNIGILAPMVAQPGKLFTNFWGAVSESGFYARAPDYVALAERQRRGVWNVPFVGGALLIGRAKLRRADFADAFAHDPTVDADMSFAQFCRENNHFMFVTNMDEYGYLVESEHFAYLPPEYIHRELYNFPHNKALWEKRYIHNDYFALLEPKVEVPMACTDVYEFPLVSERFCSEMIEIMEHYGQWSDGTNYDKRLDGGYENVPTRDIHMNQIGFETQWLAVVDAYVAPVQEKVFIGYYQRPVRSSMMFVVRYKPEEQPALRPHQDASTYSIDIALNKRDVDYEGGGVHYLRYNCTVPADQVGWSMMFPGRLTHMHEGLPTTKGTRYILVSFLNP